MVIIESILTESIRDYNEHMFKKSRWETFIALYRHLDLFHDRLHLDHDHRLVHIYLCQNLASSFRFHL
jgi:hypothetical protein